MAMMKPFSLRTLVAFVRCCKRCRVPQPRACERSRKSSSLLCVILEVPINDDAIYSFPVSPLSEREARRVSKEGRDTRAQSQGLLIWVVLALLHYIVM